MGSLLWLDNKLEGYKEFGYVFRWVNILGKVLKCIFLGKFFNLVMIVGKKIEFVIVYLWYVMIMKFCNKVI